MLGDLRRGHQLVALRVDEGVLELDDARVGCLVVAAGLGELLRELVLQLLGLLLLLGRLGLEGVEVRLLLLQLVGLLLQRVCLGLQLIGLLLQRVTLLLEARRLRLELGPLPW